MRIGLGIPAGSLVASAAGSNPNLLRWTEEFDNAVWTVTAVSIGADEGVAPDGSLTADSATDIVGGGTIRQISLTPSSSGSAATAIVTPGATWGARFSVTGTFDGLGYTFSIGLLDLSASATLRLRIDRFAGKLRCSVENVGGAATFYLWGAQFEQAGSASLYSHRTT